MNKLRKGLPFFFAISLTLVFLMPNTVSASPGTATYDSRPSAHTITGGLGVTNPTYAYDNNLGTYAQFDYDDVVGSFAVRTFSQSSGVILSVDFKMHYEADGSGGSEAYRIIYYVGVSGPVVLVPWTFAAHALSTQTWSNQAEPTDGSWSWTDIGNIRFVVETGTGGGGADRIYEHEAWVTVTIYSYTTGTMFVDPASLTDPSSPFTVDINVSNVEDLYGWEFKLYYNSTILSNSSVTEGAFLSSAGSTFFNVLNNTDTYNATHGRFWVSCTLLGHTAGKTGGGTLATITFTVDGNSGTTPLALDDTKLVGYVFAYTTLVQMSHNTTDGQVSITSTVPEFPFGAALELALAGIIIYIWRRSKHPPA
jgi:hypothetical protein